MLGGTTAEPPEAPTHPPARLSPHHILRAQQERDRGTPGTLGLERVPCRTEPEGEECGASEEATVLEGCGQEVSWDTRRGSGSGTGPPCRSGPGPGAPRPAQEDVVTVTDDLP